MEDLPAIERWFCENFKRWVGREAEMPFDQHMLAALVAPRLLAISSAAEDDWADPPSEFISAYETGRVHELLGLPGLCAPAEFPAVGTRLTGGRAAYQLRPGAHYMSRTDWNFYMKFFGKATHE
jgi:hypothetical protein